MAKYFCIILLLSLSSTSIHAAEHRCGWLKRYIAPDSWRLSDAHDVWIFPLQGDDDIDYDSADNIPTLIEQENDLACVCLTVNTDKASKRILRIVKGKALPIKKCKDDKKLLAH